MKAIHGIAAALLAGALFATGVVAADSPALSLQTVELVGALSGKVKREDVVEAGGLEQGTSLLRLPTDLAARRIETLPWVLHADVERILPSRIRVRIVERRPAFVAMAGATPWLLDNQGRVLERSDAGYLRILDLPLPPLRPGLNVGVPQLVHTARIVDGLPPFLRSRLNRIRASSIDRITLELVDGGVLIYGAAEQIEDKNFAAQRLLELYDRKGMTLESIDVRVPSRPAVKPRPVP